jgi:hypothetical protein
MCCDLLCRRSNGLQAQLALLCKCYWFVRAAANRTASLLPTAGAVGTTACEGRCQQGSRCRGRCLWGLCQLREGAVQANCNAL